MSFQEKGGLWHCVGTSQELEDLDEAAKLFSATTTEDSDGHGDDESSEADKRFMKEAQEEAQKSRDTNTRVSSWHAHVSLINMYYTGWCCDSGPREKGSHCKGLE